MWLFLFGSIWGINEVFLGEILYRNDIQNSSVILTAMALFLLAKMEELFLTGVRAGPMLAQSSDRSLSGQLRCF